MATKRRNIEVFSLSFLDCICCGFGAMLLLFVLLIGRKATQSREDIISSIMREIIALETNTKKEEQESGAIREKIKVEEERIAQEIANREVIKKDLTSFRADLALLLEQRSTLKEELERLLGQKKAVPKQDETPPIPIPNPQRRQYLSGFNFEGDAIVFLVEASGGMIGYSVDEVIKLLPSSPETKRATEKWRRVVRSVQWIIANLGPEQGYHLVTFNKEPRTLLEERETEWLEPLDRETTAQVLSRLAEVTPEGGANLERAFRFVKERFPIADTIVLITDSLPTLSDSLPVGSTTDDRDRELFFRAAIKELPRGIPVNTLLFPMSGDPAAPYLFWQLADSTKGSLISPSPTWPDI